MRKSNTYSALSDRITPNSEFEISGEVSKSTVHSGWQYIVKVTKPDTNKSNFTEFKLYTSGGGMYCIKVVSSLSFSVVDRELKVTADRKGDNSPTRSRSRTRMLQIIRLFDTKIYIFI